MQSNENQTKPTVAPVSPARQDHELEHYAQIFQDSARLRDHLRFDQFIKNPEHYISAASAWPKISWSVDFRPDNGRIKMWVDDTSSKRTIDLQTLRESHAHRVNTILNQLVQKTGKPDAIVLEQGQTPCGIVALGWCTRNQVRVSHRQVAA